MWDRDSYAFLDGEAPASVNPSLWRQPGWSVRGGPGIHQVRGFDLSVMTVVEGSVGWSSSTR